MSNFDIRPPAEPGLPNDNTRVYNHHRAHPESKLLINFRSQNKSLNSSQNQKEEYNIRIRCIVANLQTDEVLSISRDENGVYYAHYPNTRYGKVKPEFHDALLKLEAYALSKGYIIVRSEGERTCAQSDAGRKAKGNFVAPGGKSPHNYGVGADLQIFNIKTGKICSFHSKYDNEITADIRRYAQEECGLKWGGEWDEDYESHHFEIRGWETKYKKPTNLVEKITQSRHKKVPNSPLRA